MLKIGVIVGRWQVDELHEGHLHLINEAKKQVDILLVGVCNSYLPTTANNPLTVSQRLRMFDNIVAVNAKFVLQDHPSDRVWSMNLDERVQDTLLFLGVYGIKTENITIFHGRDTTATHYHGLMQLQEVDAVPDISATKVRADIGKWQFGEDYGTTAYRRGVIWANQNRFPTVYSTVDGAVVRIIDNKLHLLMIKKNKADGYLLPGGFAEIGSTHEEDVLREIKEETTIIADDPVYLGSFVQDDWRYRYEVDEIRTNLFVCYYVSGEPLGQDDADWAGWVNMYDDVEINHCHEALVRRVTKWYLDQDNIEYNPKKESQQKPLDKYRN